MSKRLIVNADDFGLSKGQNYGIVETFSHGIVTSTTAMVNAPEIEHAVTLSRLYPQLPVGLHFVLTTGKPITQLTSLINHENELDKSIWLKAEANQLDLEQIYRELEAQYRYFIQLFKRKPSHIDSHHHVHMIAEIYPLVEAFAQEKGLPLRIDRQLLLQQNTPVQYNYSTDHFDSGFYGDTISESLFCEVLDRAQQHGAQSVEVMTHPAFLDNRLLASKYNYQRLTELDVLTSSRLKQIILDRGYCLSSYQDL